MNRNFQFSRRYVGKLRAAVLDWSGTTADKYVLAPCVMFTETFKQFKVPITMAEARKPMGLRKDLHFKAIAEMPEVRARWKAVHGAEPTQKDVDEMYKVAEPLQVRVLPKYTGLIPGCKDAIDTLRSDFGMKIGTTTGFTKVMTDVLLVDAEKQGYVPDACVSGDEVMNGVRPKPFMLYRNLDIMDVHPIQAVVKADDTASGIEEGLSAGCWTVGFARYSNYMDVDDYEHEARLSEEELREKCERSASILRQAGAHYVVDSIADLPAVCADINRRLANGDVP